MSGIAGIGNTPLVRLDGLPGDDDAEVWVKLEAANPTGSYKDRMALAMIEDAERDGRLKPGQPVVEYSGGGTGSSLAFVCAVKGYPVGRAAAGAATDPGHGAPRVNVGTAGCFLGTTGRLRTALPTLRRVVVEPAESAVLSGGVPGTHHIEGGGIGSWPPLLRPEDFDDVVRVPEAEASAMARRAAQTDGIFSGPSTGANLVAALQIAERLGAGSRVVTVQVDSGLKYLNGPVYRTAP